MHSLCVILHFITDLHFMIMVCDWQEQTWDLMKVIHYISSMRGNYEEIGGGVVTENKLPPPYKHEYHSDPLPRKSFLDRMSMIL